MGQSLAMTPALQQAIRMLQMSTQDLQTELAEALDSNFMLEAGADDGEHEADTASPDDVASEAEVGVAEAPDNVAEVDPEDYWGSEGGAAPDSDWLDYQQASLTAETDLHDHLIWQANLCPLDDLARSMLAHLIDAVGDDGYLRDWPQLIAQWPAGSAERRALDAALAALQSFEPSGVGARDAAECLSLQLRQPERTEHYDHAVLALAERIVVDHMELLARNEPERLARALDADPEAMQAAIRCIRSLSPHPGYAFSAQREQYVTPDLVARRVNGQWVVQLNAEACPRVRVNPTYAALVRRSDRSQDQQNLRQHLQEAKQLVAALRARNDTLLRVARCIVEQQVGFMEHGPEHMCPLVLREVADRLGIHESTVSRATANKYMLTPMGVYELKYFFSSSIRTTKGGTASATAIQARIKRLIQAEAPGKPLSDAKLSECLLEDGLEVARRTVAKYREVLGIPPAHERRRMV